MYLKRPAFFRGAAAGLRGLLSVLKFALLALVTAAALWLLWSLFAYRDIPVAELEQRYGPVQRLDIDGVPLRYRVDGAGPALLLIHSHYFTMRMWESWLPVLTADFRVIRFDMTGHGLTGPEPAADYSMARDLALIEGLLEHLQVRRFSVAGSSLGGNMAFHLAARHPARVEKLVLMNSGGLPRSGADDARDRRTGTIPVWVDYASYLAPTLAFRAFLQWMIVDDSLATDALVNEFHQMFRRRGNRFAEFARLRSFSPGDPAERLARIRAPTLVMWGADNPQLPVAQVEKFAALLSNVPVLERIIYPAVGHVIPLEIAAQGSRDLHRFLIAKTEGGKR